MGYQPKPNYYSYAIGHSSHVEGTQSYASGFASSWDAMVNAVKGLGTTAQEAANTINALNQYINNQLGPETPAKTENPNQKSDLEISNRIEINPEFQKLSENIFFNNN